MTPSPRSSVTPEELKVRPLSAADASLVAAFRSRQTGGSIALVRVALAIGADGSERMGCRLVTVDAYRSRHRDWRTRSSVAESWHGRV